MASRNIYDRYAAKRLGEFGQDKRLFPRAVDFLSAQGFEAGVCDGMCDEWIRRVLDPIRRTASGFDQVGLRRSAFFNADLDDNSKFEKRLMKIISMQELAEDNDVHVGNVRMALHPLDPYSAIVAYGGLPSDDSFRREWLSITRKLKNDSPAERRSSFNRIWHVASYVRKLSQPQTRTGGCAEHIGILAKKLTPGRAALIYLAGGPAPKIWGHSVAMYRARSSDGYYFLDPEVGEYRLDNFEELRSFVQSLAIESPNFNTALAIGLHAFEYR